MDSVDFKPYSAIIPLYKLNSIVSPELSQGTWLPKLTVLYRATTNWFSLLHWNGIANPIENAKNDVFFCEDVSDVPALAFQYKNLPNDGGFGICFRRVIIQSSRVVSIMAENPPAMARKQLILLLWSIIFSVIFFFSVSCASDETVPGDIREVIAEGRALLGEDTTPAQAKALALNEARRMAVERATGILVRSASVVYNSELISDLISAFSKGLIVREDILFEGLRTEDGRAVYVCRINASIKPVMQKKQKGIRIANAGVSRVDSPFFSSSPVFQDNDEIRIRVKTEGDLHINVFSVSQDGRIVLLLPNPYVKLEKVSGGQDIIFPDEAMRRSGFKLRVHTPKNLSRAYETIVIIATKERKDFLFAKSRDATLSDLMGELSMLEQTSWADAVIGYEVRR